MTPQELQQERAARGITSLRDDPPTSTYEEPEPASAEVDLDTYLKSTEARDPTQSANDIVKSFSQAYRPVRDSDHAAEIYEQLQSTPTGIAQTAQKSAEKLATDAANTLKSSVTNSAKQSATVLENSVSKALKDATGIDLKALRANPADTLSRLGRDKIDEVVNNATKLAQDKVEESNFSLKGVIEGILAGRGEALSKTYEDEFEKGETEPTASESESTQPLGQLQGMFGHAPGGFQEPRAFGNPWYS